MPPKRLSSLPPELLDRIGDLLVNKDKGNARRTSKTFRNAFVNPSYMADFMSLQHELRSESVHKTLIRLLMDVPEGVSSAAFNRVPFFENNQALRITDPNSADKITRLVFEINIDKSRPVSRSPRVPLTLSSQAHATLTGLNRFDLKNPIWNAETAQLSPVSFPMSIQLWHRRFRLAENAVESILAIIRVFGSFQQNVTLYIQNNSGVPDHMQALLVPLLQSAGVPQVSTSRQLNFIIPDIIEPQPDNAFTLRTAGPVSYQTMMALEWVFMFLTEEQQTHFQDIVRDEPHAALNTTLIISVVGDDTMQLATDTRPLSIVNATQLDRQDAVDSFYTGYEAMGRPAGKLSVTGRAEDPLLRSVIARLDAFCLRPIRHLITEYYVLDLDQAGGKKKTAKPAKPTQGKPRRTARH